MKITKEAVRNLSERERLRALSALSWWENYTEAAFAKTLINELEYSPENVWATYERLSFAYEAEARLRARKTGEYEWAQGKRFSELSLGQVEKEHDRLGGIGWNFSALRREKIQVKGRGEIYTKTKREGNWSEPFQFNLDAPIKELESTFNGVIRRERERLARKGTKTGRRNQVLWDGLSAFDKNFLGFSLSNTEDKNKRRALDAFADGHF